MFSAEVTVSIITFYLLIAPVMYSLMKETDYLDISIDIDVRNYSIYFHFTTN